MKRVLLFVAALLVALPALAATKPASDTAGRVVRVGDMTLLLSKDACSVQAAVIGLKPHHLPRFANGIKIAPGERTRFCWTDLEVDGTKSPDSIFVWDEEGGNGWLLLDKESPGI